MGSGYSRKCSTKEKCTESDLQKRTCPTDYDKDKFNMILELYDKLDENGDNIVDALELQDISELHVSNKILLLKMEDDEDQSEFDKEIQSLEIACDKEKQRINEEFSCLRKEKLKIITAKKEIIAEKIKMLKTMNVSTRNELFLSTVAGDKKHINFWRFYEYMKKRTNDIKNINFKR
jgi:hypothetical protein